MDSSFSSLLVVGGLATVLATKKRRRGLIGRIKLQKKFKKFKTTLSTCKVEAYGHKGKW